MRECYKLLQRFSIMNIGHATLASLLLISPAIAVDEYKFADLAESRAVYDKSVKPLLVQSCGKCHQGEEAEGELDLLALDPDLKGSTSAARWAMVVEKVVSREMPPPEGKPLTESEFKTLTGWIAAEMKRSGKHLARREAYQNGNKIPHHMLFDPQQNFPLETAPRIRTLSPEIYAGTTKNLSKGFENLIGQPFSPGGKSTFKDMSLPKVDEPVTAQLIRNALLIAERQTTFKREGDEIKPLVGAQKDLLPFLDEAQPFGPKEIESLVKMQFVRVLERNPTAEELTRFTAFLQKSVADSGRVIGIRHGLAAVLLLREAIFRYEIGSGQLDDAGRVRLAPQEIAAALSFALTDARPPQWLLDTARQGELDTTKGVATAAQRMLDDSKMDKPRIMRFFREYFGYENATEVFKEMKDMPGHSGKTLVEDTDHLIEMILEQDKNVLKELLTTNKAFVSYKTAAESRKKRADALAKFEADKAKNPVKFANKKPSLPGRAVYESYNLTEFPETQPVELPSEQRAGILTQPAWLVAWSTADDNHVILRGKWIRERLLGGVVPDIPITVDAQLPIEPDKSLRERMRVTHETYCWQCHQFMNRVGFPFEMYDHFGRYRTGERALDLAATAKNVDPKNGKSRGPVYHDLPLDASGGLEFTLDPKLQGDVKNAIEFVHKLAESEVVEQVFVRHAFRYWMARNENLGDAASLQRAHRAYRDSQGSMNALIVSLLSCDAFLYRISSDGISEESAKSAANQ